jgi:hypothetical protein
MLYAQMKLGELAASQRVMKNASAILFAIVISDGRGRTIYESLKKTQGMIKDLDDPLLTKLYDKIFLVFRSGVPHQQIIPDDYFAFLERLGTLLKEAAAQADEAHIGLREAIKFESVIGAANDRNQSH